LFIDSGPTLSGPTVTFSAYCFFLFRPALYADVPFWFSKNAVRNILSFFRARTLLFSKMQVSLNHNPTLFSFLEIRPSSDFPVSRFHSSFKEIWLLFSSYILIGRRTLLFPLLFVMGNMIRRCQGFCEENDVVSSSCALPLFLLFLLSGSFQFEGGRPFQVVSSPILFPEPSQTFADGGPLS